MEFKPVTWEEDGFQSSVSMGLAFQSGLTMAFQPIVDVTDKSVFAHEALVRGVHGESAASVLLSVSPGLGPNFDQQCLKTAFELAQQLQLADTGSSLAINFIPGVTGEFADSLAKLLADAEASSLELNRIIFECRDTHWLDVEHTINVFEGYRTLGFRTALDNFGPTEASLKLLPRFQPDFVKLDMAMVRNVDTDPIKQKVLAFALRYLRDLGIQPICGGVETYGEFEAVVGLGVRLVQGYFFARPMLEQLTTPRFPT